jgi:hypothetical protein
MKPEIYVADRTHRLPPLILHPFTDAASPAKLVQSSRASLMLQGLLPNEEYSVEQLEKTIVDGRFCEIRMLCYVGRDVARWVDQCLEVTTRDPGLRHAGIQPPSFTTLLIDDTPEPIRDKLSKWGVQDYGSIFSRAVALNGIFAEVPNLEQLTADFVKHYHVYADRLYQAWRELYSWRHIRSEDFNFELYASSEYSRMLAREWENESADSQDTGTGPL